MHVKDTIYKNNIQFKKQSSFLKKKTRQRNTKERPSQRFSWTYMIHVLYNNEQVFLTPSG